MRRDDWISGPHPLRLPANGKRGKKEWWRERAGVRMNERKKRQRKE